MSALHSDADHLPKNTPVFWAIENASSFQFLRKKNTCRFCWHRISIISYHLGIPSRFIDQPPNPKLCSKPFTKSKSCVPSLTYLNSTEKKRKKRHKGRQMTCVNHATTHFTHPKTIKRQGLLPMSRFFQCTHRLNFCLEQGICLSWNPQSRDFNSEVVFSWELRVFSRTRKPKIGEVVYIFIYIYIHIYIYHITRHFAPNLRQTRGRYRRTPVLGE